MAATTIAPDPGRLGAGSEALRAKWRWIVALGLVYVLAGLIALSSVALAIVAKVLVGGVIMLVAGASEAINAFQAKSWGKFLLWVILGGLYIVAGVLTLGYPFLGAAILTLVLAAAVVASGIARTFLASKQARSHWTWVLLAGLVAIFLGIVILSHWVVTSVYVFGFFLGFDLIVVGASSIRLGLDLESK